MKISYDARGLAEPDAQPPNVAKIEGEGPGRQAVFDAASLSTRQINLELRRLIYAEGITDVTIQNPGAKHSIAPTADRCDPSLVGRWTTQSLRGVAQPASQCQTRIAIC